MKTLTHGYVNAQIMKHLDLVGFGNFHNDLKKGYVCYEVKYLCPDSNFELVTEFEIRESVIKKDSEFHGINIRTKESKQLIITRFSQNENSPLLQDLFDKWYSDYLKYMEE